MVLLLLIASLSSVIFFLLLLLLLPKSKQNQALRPPPGPRGLPLIGNMFQFKPSNSHIYFSNLGKTYGSIFTLGLMGKSMVVIQSAELAKEVLQKQDENFCSRPQTAGRKKLSYNGLDIALSPYSEYLKEIKKVLVVNLLSSKNVDSFAPIRQEEVSRLIQKVSSLSFASKTVNLSQLVLNYAASNASRITFGKRYDDEDVFGSRYWSLLHEAEYMFTTFFFSDYIYLGGWIDKLTGQYSRLEKTFKDLDAIYDKIIDDHLHAIKLKSEQHDIVDVLLRLMNDTSFPFKLTIHHIKAILMVCT
ncbi:hypothetical protein SOVF_179900 [Spinacia oleracea]|nr:hypothetical protein SOVF_179900 [Spinacia oleracea]